MAEVSCPGCGAPKAHRCPYCGRREWPAPIEDRWRGVPVSELDAVEQRNAMEYLRINADLHRGPGMRRQPPPGILGNLLVAALGII